MVTLVSVSLMNSILAAAKENDDVKAILEKMITEPGLKVVHDDDQRAVDISEQFLYPAGARQSQLLLQRVQESAADEDLVTAVKIQPMAEAPNTTFEVRNMAPGDKVFCWMIFLKKTDGRYHYEKIKDSQAGAEEVAQSLAKQYHVPVEPIEDFPSNQ